MIALRYTVDPFPASPAPQGGFSLLESAALPSSNYAAFTDLAYAAKIGSVYGTLFACWREGTTHASTDGVIVVARKGGPGWSRCAVLSTPYTDKRDLRDPKITVLADGSLMINTVATNNASLWQSLVAFSADGNTWSAWEAVGELNYWLWRPARNGTDLYGVGYAPLTNPTDTRLYKSVDGGHTWSVIVGSPFVPGGVLNDKVFSETALLFRSNGQGLAVARSDFAHYSPVGVASAPYTSWTWTNSTPTAPDASDSRTASPCLLELPDGRILVAGRRYHRAQPGSTGQQAILAILDPATAAMPDALLLSSNPDNSGGADVGYNGLIYFRGAAWTSYHSNAPSGGNPVIYLDRVAVA